MSRSLIHTYWTAAIHADFSLQFVVWTSIGLFWIVIFLAIYMMFYRTYYHLRQRYEQSRKALYEPSIEKVVMEDPMEEIMAILRPRRWGDRLIVQNVILEADRKSTRLNSSHSRASRMPSSA